MGVVDTGFVWINSVLLTKKDKYYFIKVLAPLLNAKMSDIVRLVDSNFDLSLPKKTQKHIKLCHKIKKRCYIRLTYN